MTRLLRNALPLLLGIALTLTLRGYNFGGGNHTVYLIAPLREVHPELLANDWWSTHTLQYHVAYTKLTALLMRLNIVQPAFLVLYLGLVLLLHLGWLRIALSLGLTARHYLLSVLLYYLSAGGTGLGSYQFLQDSSFLPGNVANIALLWAIAFWIDQRTWPAAICFALASLWHLNHALVALAFWPAGILLNKWRRRPARDSVRKQLLAFLLILLFAFPNLIPAARLSLAHLPKMPLAQFVDLYVHLRHPHHYDPLAWPLALWLSFLWPIPLAGLALRKLPRADALRRAVFVVLFFSALLGIALIFAGVFFVSEPLIQMSLFRFSLYPKLLTCVGAAAWILSIRGVRPLLLLIPVATGAVVYGVYKGNFNPTATDFISDNRFGLGLLILLVAAGSMYVGNVPRGTFLVRAPLTVALVCILLFAAWHKWLGLNVRTYDNNDRDYIALCLYARDHTPVDAVFLVPPNEQLFRYHAQRAIVANFKNVPQFSSEMRKWQIRLETILGRSLQTLPTRFDKTHAAIADRYDKLPYSYLEEVARKYGARYVVTAKPQAGVGAVFENASYHLYDLDHPR